MSEQLRVRTPCFLQRVRKNRQIREGSLLVDSLGDLHDDAVVPCELGGIDDDGAKRVAEDVAEEFRLLFQFEDCIRRLFAFYRK